MGDLNECKVEKLDLESLNESDDLTGKSCSKNLKNIELINKKINDFVNVSNSSASDLELKLKKNIVHAQIHSHKYLESDV